MNGGCSPPDMENTADSPLRPNNHFHPGYALSCYSKQPERQSLSVLNEPKLNDTNACLLSATFLLRSVGHLKQLLRYQKCTGEREVGCRIMKQVDSTQTAQAPTPPHQVLTGCTRDLRFRILLCKTGIMLSATYWGHCDGQVRVPSSW